jgi:hypothetical protein
MKAYLAFAPEDTPDKKLVEVAGTRSGEYGEYITSFAVSISHLKPKHVEW